MSRDTKFVLCYVTDRRSLAPASPRASMAALVDNAARVAALGVDWILIREKDLDGGPLLQLVQDILRRSAPARVLVNDRLDVALAAGAEGVHLGVEGLPVAAARRWLGERRANGFLIGKSCHSLDDARAAENEGVDYIFFGPVFSTPSKIAYGPPQGTTRLTEVCRRLSIPVIAIGGIAPENAAACAAAGARGIAAIRCFQEPGDLVARIAGLRAAGS